MTNPVGWPDAADAVKLILRDAMSDAGVDCYVTNDIPSDWVPDDRPHLSVFDDGAARTTKRVAQWPTIRVIARAATAEDPAGFGPSRRLAAQAQALLLAHPGGRGVSSCRPLLGPLPSPAPETGTPTAWFTVRAAVRAVPLGDI